MSFGLTHEAAHLDESIHTRMLPNTRKPRIPDQSKLLQSEMRGFRTTVEQLVGVDLFLAERFTSHTEPGPRKITTSFLPDTERETDSDEAPARYAMGPFGHPMVKQCNLLN